MPYTQSRQYSILQEQRVLDGILVEQALAGDQCAFEFLVNRYHQPLVSYIRGFLKDNDQSYDVLQHVYLQLYLSLPILLRNVSLKAWLFQVARNRCLDELRKRRRRDEVPFSTLEREDWEEGLSPLEAIPDPEPLPEEITERGELNGSLHVAIVSLPPKISFDRASALFQATDLRGNWAHTQNAGDDREEHLLPLFAALAQSTCKQRAICIDLVEYRVARRKKGFKYMVALSITI